MGNTINTPQKSVELKEVPDNVKTVLTQEEYNEVIRAQKNAAYKQANERMAILQSEISTPTQKKLKEKWVELAELAEEKGITDKAKDVVENTAEWVVTNFENARENISADGVKWTTASVATAVGLGNWVRRAENLENKMTTFDKFKENPLEFIKEAFQAFVVWIKSGFSDMSAFEAVFGDSKFMEQVSKWIANINENFVDISDAMMVGWKELFRIKDFKNITIEKLREASVSDDIAKSLWIPADNEVLKKFCTVILDKDNFAKMSLEVEKGLGQKIDEKVMSIGDFITKLA